MTLTDWQSGPENRWAFQHVDEVVPCLPMPRGDGPVLELADAPEVLGDWVDDFVGSSYTDGIVVLRGRDVLYERYLNDMTPTTRHLLQSVSKSLTSAIVGRYVESGALRVDEVVSTYVPELVGSAYADASVQQVLDMLVAVKYDEEYANPESEVQTHERAGGWRTPLPGDPADTYEFLPTLQKSGEHGRTFAYCSANTDVLAWILERVAGRTFVELLSTDLWSLIGAEHDAYVSVDSAGFGMASGGICVTLRDLARFGRVVLDGGVGPRGSVVPAAWLADTRRGGDVAAAAESMGETHPGGSYRNQFWITGDDHGCFYGVGIYGQYLWMDPVSDVVVAKHSSLPVADSDDEWRSHVAFFTRLSHGLQRA
jgi:CubicO group peptidase (beta-lactamase class C family)